MELLGGGLMNQYPVAFTVKYFHPGAWRQRKLTLCPLTDKQHDALVIDDRDSALQLIEKSLEKHQSHQKNPENSESLDITIFSEFCANLTRRRDRTAPGRFS
jgi:hypothetical protein